MERKILLVEDERTISRFIELELQHENFDVTVLDDGRKALDRVLEDGSSYDLLLLDVMLPSLNGIEVCRRVRAISDVPIILITARDAVMDRVAGLDAGADDYIVKPFAIEELLARIRSLFRRSTLSVSNESKLKFCNITMDIEAYEVYVDNTKIDLTKTEFDLLKLLMENKNRVCKREYILDAVWEYRTDVETNVVDVYIRHLRAKLPKKSAELIETVRGVGYVMREGSR